MKNKVQIKIDGKDFTLVGTESEEYITSVADYVNEKIDFIRESDKNCFLTSYLAVILTCVNITDELFKEREKTDGINSEEVESLKNKISELEKEVEDLLNSNRELTEEFDEERALFEKEKDELKGGTTALPASASVGANSAELSEINRRLHKLIRLTEGLEADLKSIKTLEGHKSMDRERKNRAEAYGNK